MVGRPGFEPATWWSQVGHPNHSATRPHIFWRAGQNMKFQLLLDEQRQKNTVHFAHFVTSFAYILFSVNQPLARTSLSFIQQPFSTVPNSITAPRFADNSKSHCPPLNIYCPTESKYISKTMNLSSRRTRLCRQWFQVLDTFRQTFFLLRTTRKCILLKPDINTITKTMPAILVGCILIDWFIFIILKYT